MKCRVVHQSGQILSLRQQDDMSAAYQQSMRCNMQQAAEVAAIISVVLEPQDCLLLQGDLGAGKTYFAKHLIQACCGADCHVTSPTFAISQSYQPIIQALSDTMLWHYDLYRLQYVHEVEETGLLDSLMSGVTLIEWPDIAASYLPDDALHITFAFAEDSHYREVSLSGDALWGHRLSQKF